MSLILPPNVRLAKPDEIPNSPEKAEALRRIATARFEQGYLLDIADQPGFTVFAEANVDNTRLWDVFVQLVSGLLPNEAALLLGFDPSDEPEKGPYASKASLLKMLAPFGRALASDGYIAFGAIWQEDGEIEEVFVTATKYIQVWTNQPERLKSIFSEAAIPPAEHLSFIDEYPRITETMVHQPWGHGPQELFNAVLARCQDLPSHEDADA